jgi:hypothetical protein
MVLNCTFYFNKGDPISPVFVILTFQPVLTSLISLKEFGVLVNREKIITLVFHI